MTSSQQEGDSLALHQPPSKKQKLEEETPIKKLAPSSQQRNEVIHSPTEELPLPITEVIQDIWDADYYGSHNCDIHRDELFCFRDSLLPQASNYSPPTMDANFGFKPNFGFEPNFGLKPPETDYDLLFQSSSPEEIVPAADVFTETMEMENTVVYFQPGRA